MFSARAAHTVLPLASAAIVINGLQGTYLHWRGIAQRPGGITRYNLEVRAAGVRAAARLAGRRHGPAGRGAAPRRPPPHGAGWQLMPYRSPNQRAVTPQGRGRFPGFDVLDQVDAVG